MAKPGQIVAMGGGGFSMDSTTLLDDYILGLTGKERPRVCFLPTAAGDSPCSLARFYEAFPVERCLPGHLPLFGRPRADIAEYLRQQDVIYVGGGNTANLLALWRLHGVHRALRAAWESGVILAGLSAGMICWFEAGVTDSFGALTGMRDGLGFLPGSACPHYDGEADRRPAYRRLLEEGFPPGYAADDGAALHFVGRDLSGCVSSRPNARAYHVDRSGERPLETRYLGAP